MRLIDADALMDDIATIRVYLGGKEITDPEYRETVLIAIDNAPTVDAIVPPVMVGQTVWFASRYHGIVYPITIRRIDIEDDGMTMIDDNFSVWSDTDVGKRIFLTREAAEEALKTREKA